MNNGISYLSALMRQQAPCWRGSCVAWVLIGSNSASRIYLSVALVTTGWTGRRGSTLPSITAVLTSLRQLLIAAHGVSLLSEVSHLESLVDFQARRWVYPIWQDMLFPPPRE